MGWEQGVWGRVKTRVVFPHCALTQCTILSTDRLWLTKFASLEGAGRMEEGREGGEGKGVEERRRRKGRSRR